MNNSYLGYASATFRPIRGFAGYAVGDDGTVWSCHINGARGGIGNVWRKLKPRADKDGYLSVTLFRKTKRHTIRVSHLVLTAFVGPRQHGQESCHYPDPRVSNNRLCNLKWASHAENIKHKVQANRQAKGGRHGMAKYSVGLIRKLRAHRASTNDTYTEMSAIYGVERSHICSIVNRKAWGHIK